MGVHQGITSDDVRGLYEMLAITPILAIYKANTLLDVLWLLPQTFLFYRK